MTTNKLNFNSFIYIFLLISVDIIALIIALLLAIEIRANLLPDYFPLFRGDDLSQYYWILFLTLLIFLNEKIYFIRYDFWGDTKRVLKGLFFSFIVVLIVITLSKMSSEYSRTFLIIFFLLAMCIIPLFKRYLKRFIFQFQNFTIKVKIVAKGAQYSIMSEEIRENWYFGFELSDDEYDMVLIGSKKFNVDELQEMIKTHSKNTKDIYVVPYMDHLDFSHTTIVDYSNIRFSAIHIENRLLNFKNRIIKFVFEKCLVILLSPLILLVHIILSILIKRDSKGPILFKQKRYGKNAEPFTCYKYRTMHTNNDTILEEYLENNPDEKEYYNIYCKYKKDPRITKIGKFLRQTSLDEFPQFFNVLRGDMNLIGPRPYMLTEKNKIGSIHEEVILEIEPGITGLWQVSGRNNLSFKERVHLDKWYIQNWSLWIDFVIFMKTIKVVLFKIGAK